MPKSEAKKRDKQITREIHRLFWRANFQDKYGVIACLSVRLVAFSLLHIFMPLVIAYGIQAIVDQRFDDVPGYAWWLILIALGYAVFWTIGGVLISRNGVIGGAYLQRQVFANYLNKDYDFYANTYFGSLGAQALRLREAFNNQYNLIVTLTVPKQLVIVLGGVIVIAFHSLVLAAVTLLAMFFVLSFTILFGKWRLKWRRKVSEESSNLSAMIGDALTQAPAVKSYAAEGHEENRLRSTLRAWQHAQQTSWMLALPADAGRYLLVAIATALLLVLTANMYRDGTISIAIVTLVQLYVIKMIAAALDINEIIKNYETAMGSAYQPVKTMLHKPTIVDDKQAQKLSAKRKYPMTFRNVTFSFSDAKGAPAAVKDFSLTIKPGEKVGLVGYSGSGKTTLTKLILRFMDVTGGYIKIAGKDVRSVAQQDLRRHIAYVPQEPLLFHRSITENIAYGRPTARKKEIETAAKMAYVNEFLDELSDGYDTLVGERGVKLSGGQRQRVAIARAILKDAPILVLDEATSALDSRSEKLIQKALWRLMKDRTALVIAHRLSTIHHMDRIVVMDKGKIVQTGSHDELLRDKKGIYAELWAHQSGGYIGLPDEDSE